MTDKIFGKSREEWIALNGIHTAGEIHQQPDTWRKTLEIIRSCKAEFTAFIERITSQEDYEILFSGAGTSEYVGSAAIAELNRMYGYHMRDIGTTDVVMAPEKYLSPDRPTLLVSLARSGNSKESVATVKLADEFCGNVQHLFITCNPDGALAHTAAERDNCYMILLPPETNDRGLAMTSSFSNMYLALLLVFAGEKFEEFAEQTHAIADATERYFKDSYTQICDIVDTYPFNRIILLGASELKNIAREASLKLLELNKGNVIPYYENTIAFRHGARAMVRDETLSVLFMSDNAYTRQYEIDLIKEMQELHHDHNRIFLCENYQDNESSAYADYCVDLKCAIPMRESFLGLGYVAIMQLLAFLKSQSYGINSDDFSDYVDKETGVIIYPYA